MTTTAPTIIEQLFADLKVRTEEYQEIVSSFEAVNFRKGEIILHSGDTVHHYYFIQTGFIRSYAVDLKGNEITTNFFGPGDIVIDWSSFFLRTPTQENFEVSATTECYRLSFQRFQELFHRYESFRESGRARFAQGYFSLKRKSTEIITKEATERYLDLIRERPEVLQNASLKHIATYLGITDTSLSRIRKTIARQ